MEAKAELCDFLKVQNTQLHSVDVYLRYTGHQESEEFETKKEVLNQSIAVITEKMNDVQGGVHHAQSVVQRCREGVRQLLQTLGMSATEVTEVGDLKSQTLLLQTKVLNLVKEVNELRLEMAPSQPIVKDLAKCIIIPPKCPKRLVRVVTPPASDEEEEDVKFGISQGGKGGPDNFVDVLGRAVIKKKKVLEFSRKLFLRMNAHEWNKSCNFSLIYFKL